MHVEVQGLSSSINRLALWILKCRVRLGVVGFVGSPNISEEQSRLSHVLHIKAYSRLKHFITHDSFTYYLCATIQ